MHLEGVGLIAIYEGYGTGQFPNEFRMVQTLGSTLRGLLVIGCCNFSDSELAKTSFFQFGGELTLDPLQKHTRPQQARKRTEKCARKIEK